MKIYKNKLEHLEELIRQAKICRTDYNWVIEKFYCDNNIEDEAIEMLSKISKEKIKKQSNYISYLKYEYLPYGMNYYYLFNKKSKYTYEEAKLLNELYIDYIRYADFTKENVERARKVIPNIECPKIYLIDIVIHLHKKYNINFKDIDYSKTYFNEYHSLNFRNLCEVLNEKES